MEHCEPEAEAGGASPKKTGFIGKVWRGDYPLWLSFWVLCLGTGLAMMFFWSSLGMAVIKPGTLLHSLAAWLGPVLWMVIALPLFGASCLYMLIALVGAWRSAGRYQGWKIWRWLAWLVLAFVMVNIAIPLLLRLDSLFL